ncbi:MAG: 2'-5' RNA ligase family protein [Dietzia sp.]|nr:2'-5' RNA ligase family protein [Dietzia sp.]
MQRFFDRPDTRWRQPGGCLHLYALPAPGAAILDEFAEAASALEALPGLGAQPTQYMHVTVQRLDAFVHELEDDRWGRAWRSLEEVLAAHRPFELDFAPPRPGTHAVEAVAQATDPWDRLGSAVRGALAATDLGHVLAPPPHAPHYTLAYCVAETGDAEVRAALAGTRATSFLVDRLSLVVVEQDRDAGVFRFETLSEWGLGR